jgi:ribonuclease HI
MDPVKIAGIQNWPTPIRVKDVRSFLGFCNFYQPFIRGFAHLARPLNELTRKDTEWSWETQHQTAFEELKKRVTTEPVLAHPILTDPFELEVDASGFAMGAVLLQKKEDGKKHPIAYYSKTLSAAERNYDVYNLELLAIVNALDHWRPYLAGSPHKIIIYSDHQNLLYWKEPHKISRRVAREVLMLSEYNFEIRHIKGIANRQADALSRCPDYDQGQDDNQDVTVLPEQVFIRTMEVLSDHTTQEESVLKPWIDPHQLKQHQGVLLRSVDRSVRLGRLGVCPECLMAEVGKRLDYNGAMDKHTRGECVSSTEREGRKGLCKVFQPKRMRCRDSTKYAQRGCIGEVAEALQSIQLGPSDTRSQSYRLLAKLSSLIY